MVKVAHDKPRRYGSNGELLINYEHTEEVRRGGERRRSSGAPQSAQQQEKVDGGAVDQDKEKSNVSR